MEYEKIRQLINEIDQSTLTDVDISFTDGTRISIKKENNKNYIDTDLKSKEVVINNEQLYTNKEEKKSEGNIVKSPMVGTFYIKPSPTAEPYVEIGKDVKIGDTLCIIEAMKLMNEIESEYSCKILAILVKNADIVEYGTTLFKIG